MELPDSFGSLVKFRGVQGRLIHGYIVDYVGCGFYIVRIKIKVNRELLGVPIQSIRCTDVLVSANEFESMEGG